MPIRLSISEILEKVSEAKTKDEKIETLRGYDNAALRLVLQYAFDPRVEFLLPDGEPPFKENPYPDQHMRLYSEARRLYLFTNGGPPGLTPLKRETLFIQLIESIDPKDAKLICAVKDKKIPYKGVTVKLVAEAFPDVDFGLGNEDGKV